MVRSEHIAQMPDHRFAGQFTCKGTDDERFLRRFGAGANRQVQAVGGGLAEQALVLDVQLPDLDGFEVARRLALAGDPPVIVLVSTRDSSAYRRRLADSPARGFIPKGELSGAAVAALVG